MQASLTRGFWMSYHELTGYPWLTKRVARVLHPVATLPKRNVFAGVLACFTPYVGRGGGAAGLVVAFAIVGILAAVALPAYHDYTVRARITGAYLASEPARRKISAYYAEHHEVPKSLADAGVSERLPDGSTLSLDADSTVLSVDTPNGQLVFSPKEGPDEMLAWQCAPGEGLRLSQMPSVCRDDSGGAAR